MYGRGRGQLTGKSWSSITAGRGRAQTLSRVAGRGQIRVLRPTVNPSLKQQESKNRAKSIGNLCGRPAKPSIKGRVRGLPAKEQEYLNAALSGDIAILKRTISENDINLNVTDGFGHTALINAAWKDRYDIVKLLLEKKVYLDCRNHDGQTAMDKAAYWGFTGILQLLVHAGSTIDIRNNNGETPLQRAAMWGHVDAVKLLLDAKANGNEFKNQRRYTPLHFAAKHGRPAVVRALLQSNCDPRSKDCSGRTPLELAKRHKKQEVTRIFEEWFRKHEDGACQEKDSGPKIARIGRAGGWDAEVPIKKPHHRTIESGVCGFNLTKRLPSETSKERLSLTLELEVTVNTIAGDDNVTITPPVPTLAVETQGGVSAGLWGRPSQSNKVLPFQFLSGLQVSPNKGLPKSPNPLLQLDEDDLQHPQFQLPGNTPGDEDAGQKDRFWLDSPFTYL